MQQKFSFKDIEEKNHGFKKSGVSQITILQKVSRCIAFLGKMGWQLLLQYQINLSLSNQGLD